MISVAGALSTTIAGDPVLSRAMSAEAEYVEDMGARNRSHLRESVSLGTAVHEVQAELWDIYQQCREPDWDGSGADPVEQESYSNAYRLLEALPLGTPSPSVGVEADGHLTLEWRHSPRRTLSVSVDPDGELHYAAIVGLSKTYGSEPFFGDMPAPIMELIQRICVP